MAIDGTITLQTALNDRRTVGINTAANLAANLAVAIPFTDGAGANQGNVLYQGSLVMTAGAYNIDLNGLLTDTYGSQVNMLRVKGILYYNTSTHVHTIGAGTNPWITLLNSTGTLTIPPGGAFAAVTPDATGWAVTAATGDVLKTLGTGTDTFQIVILGSST